MENVKIKSISLSNYKCFEKANINCQKEDGTIYQWTILLGNNNTGKTNILRAIASMRPKKIALHLNNNKKEADNVLIPSMFPLEAPIMSGAADQNLKKEISLELTNYNHVWKCSNHETNIDSECTLENTFNIIAYGVSRYPSSTSLAESLCDDCATLFSTDERLVNIEEWLMQLDYSAKSKNKVARSRLTKIRELITSGIFPEIQDFKFENTDGQRNHVLFKSKDGWFNYTELGFGYQSMLAWVIDLAKRLFDKFPQSENPLEEEAIVLIDEIDLHLHPQWQRDVMSIVSKIFKNIQFIATTHSPLVIQSLEDVNLYVLKRENEKVSIQRSSVTNFTGWTVEEILRDSMGLSNNIHSNIMQNYTRMFNEGLDEENIEKAREAYEKLREIIRPENPMRRILEIQLNQLESHD